jgi:hypothetical protein
MHRRTRQSLFKMGNCGLSFANKGEWVRWFGMWRETKQQSANARPQINPERVQQRSEAVLKEYPNVGDAFDLISLQSKTN